MFEASCSQPTDDTGAACGIFGPVKGGGVDLTNVSMEEFLNKLDLMEYKEPFYKAGVLTVQDLAHLSDKDLEAFNLRKLEKRKLIHHLDKARGLPDNNDSLLCGAPGS